MPELVFRGVALVLFVIYTAGRAVHARERPTTEPTRTRAARRERMTVRLLLCGAVVYLLWQFSPLLDWAMVPLPEAARWVGAGVFALGTWLFWATHAALGRNWSPVLEIHEGQTLVTHGPYKYVRHPMYAAGLVAHAGQALLSANWLVALALVGPLIAMYALRVADEEQMMLEQFGEAYAAYMQRTGRLAPRVF